VPRAVALPGSGLMVTCFNPTEARYLYEYDIPAYFRHGIEVHPGDVVFDVGANIGLFSLSVLERCKGDATVYAFEAVPPIRRLLQHNVDRLAAGRVSVLPYGLSDESARLPFHHFPRLPGWSSAHLISLDQVRARCRRTLLADIDSGRLWPWLRRLPASVRAAVVEAAVRWLIQSEQMRCEVRPLSDAIRDTGVERIDLLKIDVEGGELDVLVGVDPADWQKIRQVVVELDHFAEHAADVVELMKVWGFSRIELEQPSEAHRSSNAGLLYASRVPVRETLHSLRRLPTPQDPTFAIVTIGSGSWLGSTVRDITLANALYRLGYKVVVYWMLECQPELVDPGIPQRLLCHGTRYHFRQPSGFLDRVVGSLLFLLPPARRVQAVQRMDGYVDRLLENLMRALHGTPGGDRGLATRLRRWVVRDKVSHVLMSFGAIGPLATAAQRDCEPPFDYLLSFQGDEQFAHYARRAGVFPQFREGVNAAVRASRWPAIAVSQDYLERIHDELDVATTRMRVVYNGVEFPKRDAVPAFSVLEPLFPGLIRGVPIVTYVGRQESEKGIDLLLYAARLLQQRRIGMQLVICGATAKGESCRKVLGELAEHIGVHIHHAGAIPAAVRDALFAHSRCVVYPSVNREAFGLVVVEAMSMGTPVLVPDYGGVTEVMQEGGRRAGLTFRTWDSGDLARQLERLLVDEALHRELAGNTRRIAARFTAERMAERVLHHVGIEPKAAAPVEHSGPARAAA